MVKSGSFKVGQGNLGGRIGAGLGKGLGEAIPKEVERNRLSQGLQNFAKNAGNLNPLEAFAQASSIPGVTPQMIQALPELLKLQQQRQAYANRGASEQQEAPQMQAGGISAQGNRPRNIQSQAQETVEAGERGQPQIQENNPLRPEAVPALPWSQRRREQEISRAFDEGFAQTLPEAMSYVDAKEQRELAQPKAVQEQDAYFRDQQDKADADFQKHLETKLEKKGEGVFKDITGENLVNLKRSMYKDLRTNPDATVEDVANYWSNKALDLAKTKSQLSTLENRNFLTKLTKSAETLDKLKSYQKIYAETGNQEEFYNTLKSNFELTPQGAAFVAYPRSKPVSNYISKIPKVSLTSPTEIPTKSRKYAADLENVIGRDDSFLAIAKEIKDKDRFFDQRSFFSQLREDQDSLGLTPRQKREIAEGESELFPNWGDILLLPSFKGE